MVVGGDEDEAASRVGNININVVVHLIGFVIVDVSSLVYTVSHIPLTYNIYVV